MESEDHVGLSDIIDVLNTLDNQLSPQQNDDLTLGDPSPFIDERQPPQQSPPRPQLSATKQKPKTHPEPSPHPVTTPHRVSSPGTSAGTSNGKKHKPYIKILEQPAGKTVRFRYKCEGRSAGSIPGVNSTSEIKTYPSIEIVGYKGEVVIVVSCVTKDPPYRPHPHNLVGKEGCKNGICTLVLNGEPLRAVFSNLGIQCVKKNDVKKALDEREDLKVDPFKTKFAHKDQPSSIDLNSVRLCFQAFLKTPDGVKILTPVVTDPIYDKKSISDLTISRLCSCSAKVGGGDEIIMLCEKVTKDDIKIRFYELNADGRLLWEDFAEFQQTDIHKQTAIAFKTPRYRSTDVAEKAKVFIQLMRPSDGATSEPLPFEYYPDTDHFKRKRIKTAGSPMNILRRELQKHEQLQSSKMQNDFPDASSTGVNFWNAPFSPPIKSEPAMSPLNFGPYRSPYQLASPSPQPPSPNNRLDTPSPGLVKALSAGSQTQMCDMFAYNAGLRDQKSPSAGIAYQQQEPLHQKPRQNSISTNPFSADLNIINNNISNCDFNKLVPLSTQQSPSGGMNIFIDHHTIAPSTSGGSITPIWSAEASQNNTIEAQQINIGMTQQQQLQQQQQLLQNQQLLQQVQQKQILQQQQLLQQQQHHHQQQQQQLPQQYQQLQLQQEQQQQQYQQQFQQQQQIQHDLEMLVNAATTEECPTLSGLLAYVDSEQLMNINSEDLPLSNLSIST